jgi:hypothetical protein
MEVLADDGSGPIGLKYRDQWEPRRSIRPEAWEYGGRL